MGPSKREYVPLGQFRHDNEVEDPMSVPYFPALQETQKDLPDSTAKDPGPHGKQFASDALKLDPYVPTGQLAQVVA